MEGPYRDLGGGFARLTGVEGARRGPSRITTVEAALAELLRNARDAGAENVYVASTLRRRRYRTLAVIDDGRGIPEPYKDLVFEPGVTSRHLDPALDPENPTGQPHGAGLSLYHLKTAALAAEVLSASSPTAIRATFDTERLPERSLQSGTRPSETNLLATLRTFLSRPAPRENPPNLYYSSPARILAALLVNRIIHREGDAAGIREGAAGVGLEVSLRTVQRILRGEVRPAGRVAARGRRGGRNGGRASGQVVRGATVTLGDGDLSEIAAILYRAARASYLELGELEFEARPGGITLRASVYEPEEEYE